MEADVRDLFYEDALFDPFDDGPMAISTPRLRRR